MPLTDTDAIAASSGAAGATGSDQAQSALLPVDAHAAATWSAAEHNSRIGDRDRDRFFGATDAFEESLYMLPADADEKARLHLQHVAIRTTFGGNFHTPQHELFADETVSAKILDDLVSYERTVVPDNLTFEMGNVLEGLKYPDNTFDFVHQLGWNGPMGKFFLSDTRKLFYGMKLFLMKATGVTDEEFAQLLDEAID
ncbi:hypothetical protein HK405_014846, partial [Cladochytrium tenue]